MVASAFSRDGRDGGAGIIGADIVAKPNTPEVFAVFIDREIERWVNIIRAAKVRFE